MTPTATDPSRARAAPEAGDDLRCPLCGYDLRGQVEPRCPECGYGFAWDELRDPARRLHPYLFEHHPERNVLSFIQTQLGGWRPARFWTRLTPQTPSNPRRLLAYWLLGLALALPAYALALVGTARELQADNRAVRALMTRQYTAMPPARAAAELAKLEQQTGHKLAPLLDRSEPLFPSPRFFGSLAVEPVPRFIFGVVITAVLWPWVTVAVLRGSLWISLRRANVRLVHVARCAIHAGDVIAWYWLVMAAAVCYVFTRSLQHGWAFQRNAMIGGAPPLVDQVLPLMAFLLLAVYLLSAFRLVAALKYYLRLPHAWSVVLLTQFLVVFGTFALQGLAMLAIDRIARWVIWS